MVTAAYAKSKKDLAQTSEYFRYHQGRGSSWESYKYGNDFYQTTPLASGQIKTTYISKYYDDRYGNKPIEAQVDVVNFPLFTGNEKHEEIIEIISSYLVNFTYELHNISGKLKENSKMPIVVSIRVQIPNLVETSSFSNVELQSDQMNRRNVADLSLQLVKWMMNHAKAFSNDWVDVAFMLETESPGNIDKPKYEYFIDPNDKVFSTYGKSRVTNKIIDEAVALSFGSKELFLKALKASAKRLEKFSVGFGAADYLGYRQLEKTRFPISEQQALSGGIEYLFEDNIVDHTRGEDYFRKYKDDSAQSTIKDINFNTNKFNKPIMCKHLFN